MQTDWLYHTATVTSFAYMHYRTTITGKVLQTDTGNGTNAPPTIEYLKKKESARWSCSGWFVYRTCVITDIVKSTYRNYKAWAKKKKKKKKKNLTLNNALSRTHRFSCIVASTSCLISRLFCRGLKRFHTRYTCMFQFCVGMSLYIKFLSFIQPVTQPHAEMLSFNVWESIRDRSREGAVGNGEPPWPGGLAACLNQPNHCMLGG